MSAPFTPWSESGPTAGNRSCVAIVAAAGRQERDLIVTALHGRQGVSHAGRPHVRNRCRSRVDERGGLQWRDARRASMRSPCSRQGHSPARADSDGCKCRGPIRPSWRRMFDELFSGAAFSDASARVSARASIHLWWRHRGRAHAGANDCRHPSPADRRACVAPISGGQGRPAGATHRGAWTSR